MATNIDTILESKLKIPSLYRVVILNDDYTPMDFVVEVLRDVFNKSLQEAMVLMMEVHNSGRGIAGVFTREVAEQKVYDTISAATHFGHPLKVMCEPN